MAFFVIVCYNKHDIFKWRFKLEKVKVIKIHEDYILFENDIKLYTILGNHDIAHKNSLEVNSPSLLLKEYNNIVIIDKPTVLEEYDILCIPWICSSNEKECMGAVEKSKNLIEYLDNKYKNDENVQRLKQKFNPDKISETLPTSEHAAYSENKGEKLAFCLNSQKNKTKLSMFIYYNI